MGEVADFKQPLDKELQTMQAMWKLFETLDVSARVRVLQWLMARGGESGGMRHGPPMIGPFG